MRVDTSKLRYDVRDRVAVHGLVGGVHLRGEIGTVVGINSDDDESPLYTVELDRPDSLRVLDVLAENLVRVGRVFDPVLDAEAGA